jgi:hypothetical protein
MLPASRAAAPNTYSELFTIAINPFPIVDLKSIRVQMRNRPVPIMKNMAAAEECGC